MADYIPPQLGPRVLWINNFADLLTAAPADYGLTAPDAATVAAVVLALNAAYAVSHNPATRTSPAVAQTNAENATAVATIRPYAVRIAANPAVSDVNKANIGVTIRSSVPTPIPAPTTQPALSLLAAVVQRHQLRYFDVTTPTSKRKPFGSTGMEVHVAVGVAPAVDPAAARFRAIYTKSPLFVDFDAADRGRIATYFVRWVTTAGPGGVAQPGPWSDPLSVTII